MNNKHGFKFKAILFLGILMPLFGISQAKNVLSSHRVFPKVDKVLEFEKALATHAQKYHTGNFVWRVHYIQSGPDFGGYMIVEGPKSWESEDTRGNMGTEHNIDWNKNVAIYLTERQSGGYSVYDDSLSTVALGDFAEKINIVHVYPKMGKSDNVVDIFKKLKKFWVAGGVSVAVYSESSGKPQYMLVTRYKQGLKERAAGFRKPFTERYEAVNGESSSAQYLKDVAEFTDEYWSELLFLRADLGSK